jgi:hypothetical protein
MSARRGACGVAASFFFSVVKVAASFLRQPTCALDLARHYSEFLRPWTDWQMLHRDSRSDPENSYI